MGDRSDKRRLTEAHTTAETRTDADTAGGSGLPTASEGAAGETNRPEAEAVASSTRSYALESAIYHKAREGFLDLCHRGSLALVLIGINAVVVALLKEPKIAAYVVAIPAVLASIDVAFGFASRARDHRELAAEFVSVVHTLSSAASPAEVRDAVARYYSACAREPATFEALQALAHNQACDALEDPADRGPRHVVGLPFRVLRNVLRFSATRFDLR